MADQNTTPPGAGDETPQTPGEKLQETLQQQPPPSAPETPVVPPLAERLKEFGFEGVESDADAQERLIAAYKSVQAKAEENERLVRALSQAHQPEVPQAPQKPAGEDHWWQPPQLDHQLVAAYQVKGEDGKVTWREDAPSELRRQAEQAKAHYEKWARDLIERPHEVLPKIIQHEARKLFTQEMERAQATQQAESFRERAISENEAWLFEKDPITGKAGGKLSPEGQQFQAWIDEAAEIGISSHQHQWAYAERLRKAELAVKGAQPKPADVNAQKKQELLARQTVDRSGAVPSPTQPRTQNRNISAGEKLLANMRREGVSLPT
jgi:hypothetical protein